MGYKKVYTNAEHTAHKLVQVYDDGREQEVSETQDLYIAWLAEGNTPEEVAYVAPIVVIPDTDAQTARLWSECKSYQQSRLDDAGYSEMRFKALDGGTKAAAIVAWVIALWQDYYTRKSAVTSSTDSDYDFSNNGELPYGFYEAYAEEVSE